MPWIGRRLKNNSRPDYSAKKSSYDLMIIRNISSYGLIIGYRNQVTI